MRCYNRFFNDIYLLTCLEQDGHASSHTDGKEEWTDAAGWYDQYGEKNRTAAECRPTMTDLMVDPETIGPFLDANPPAVESDPTELGCFNCRQGRHDDCVFSAEFCACCKANHQVQA